MTFSCGYRIIFYSRKVLLIMAADLSWRMNLHGLLIPLMGMSLRDLSIALHTAICINKMHCPFSTTNFVHTNPLTCVSIGLAVNREPVLAVVYAPCQREMFLAVKGCGAYINAIPIKVSTAKSISESIVVSLNDMLFDLYSLSPIGHWIRIWRHRLWYECDDRRSPECHETVPSCSKAIGQWCSGFMLRGLWKAWCSLHRCGRWVVAAYC